MKSKTKSLAVARKPKRKSDGSLSKTELKRLNKLAQIDAFQIAEPKRERNFPVVMKRTVAPGIIQVTLPDRRWYFKEINEKEFSAYPSATWVLDAGLPKGKGFNRWLSSMTEDESQKILHETGERGSRVHVGIEALLKGEKLKFGEVYQFLNNTDFTAEEWQYILSFGKFFRRFQPKVISIEQTVINEEHGFAGTVDLIGIFDEGFLQSFNTRTEKNFEPNGVQVTAVVDWKTSSAIHDSHRLQVHAYANTLKVDYAIIVRLNAKNKNGFEVFISKVGDQDQPKYFETFLNVLGVFNFLHGSETPDLSEMEEMISLQEVQP